MAKVVEISASLISEVKKEVRPIGKTGVDDMVVARHCATVACGIGVNLVQVVEESSIVVKVLVGDQPLARKVRV